jgi:hypothetical protein
MTNILVFPCGSEIGLEVHRSLSTQKDIQLIGCSSVEDHGVFVYDQYIGDIPNVYDPNFNSRLKHIILKYNIDFIYPCMDIVLHKLKKDEDILGCKVLTSEYKTTDICSSKLKTYNYFKNIIRTPNIIDINDSFTFPIFSKPEVGSSSRNVFKISNIEELNVNIKNYPNNLILEYLPGDEYTVDCFTTKKGDLKFVGARKRARISNGISVSTFSIYDENIIEIANKINSNLKFNGAWFFQLKKDHNDKFCLLEIACRFAGSSVIHRMNGINFAYLNILNELHDNLELINNNLSIKIDRSFDFKCKTNISFKNVYIDLDDTIIIKNKINIDMIRFIYEMFNRNKQIFLLTKHKFNIKQTLKKYKLSEDLFNEIIQIDKNDEKFKYIKKESSIFIDDSFSERSLVYTNLNIPVFSIDSINALL